MMKAIGLFIAFTGFFISFGMVTGCNKDNSVMTNALPMPSTTTDTGLRYLALGDSYTIGQSVGEKERFPYFVSSLLRQEGFVVNDPVYIAQTGWSTLALQNAINTQQNLGSFDIVTLLIGVNDQYQRLDTGGYRSRFTQLLNKAVALAKNNKERVFVLSIPDYSATPFVSSDKERVSKEIDQFNAINKEITEQQNIQYMNITPSTREVATNPSLLATDGLHYSGIEHKKWAEALLPYIKKQLK